MSDNTNTNERTNDLSDIFGPVISQYTRAQALADGQLVDVTETARETGFAYPVALSRALWNIIETIPKKTPWQDWQGRLWDVLWMASLSAKRCRGSRFVYEVILSREGTRKQCVQLICDCGPGDDAEPVITIGLTKDF